MQGLRGPAELGSGKLKIGTRPTQGLFACRDHLEGLLAGATGKGYLQREGPLTGGSWAQVALRGRKQGRALSTSTGGGSRIEKGRGRGQGKGERHRATMCRE